MLNKLDALKVKGQIITTRHYTKILKSEAIEQNRKVCDYDIHNGKRKPSNVGRLCGTISASQPCRF